MQHGHNSAAPCCCTGSTALRVLLVALAVLFLSRPVSAVSAQGAEDRVKNLQEDAEENKNIGEDAEDNKNIGEDAEDNTFGEDAEEVKNIGNRAEENNKIEESDEEADDFAEDAKNEKKLCEGAGEENIEEGDGEINGGKGEGENNFGDRTEEKINCGEDAVLQMNNEEGAELKMDYEDCAEGKNNIEDGADSENNRVEGVEGKINFGANTDDKEKGLVADIETDENSGKNMEEDGGIAGEVEENLEIVDESVGEAEINTGISNGNDGESVNNKNYQNVTKITGKNNGDYIEGEVSCENKNKNEISKQDENNNCFSSGDEDIKGAIAELKNNPSTEMIVPYKYKHMTINMPHQYCFSFTLQDITIEIITAPKYTNNIILFINKTTQLYIIPMASQNVDIHTAVFENNDNKHADFDQFKSRYVTNSFGLFENIVSA